MKQTIAAAVAAATLLTTTLPALADDHHDGGHDRDQHARYAQPAHRDPGGRFREGQVWRGHHMAYRNGRWGYYQPQNGASVFINIPI